MAFSRARFLQSDLIIVQGASAVSVWKNIDSLALVYSYTLLAKVFSITTGFDREWWFVAYAVAWIVLGVFVFKAFCRYVCPLGAFLALAGIALGGLVAPNWPLTTNVFLLGVANGAFSVAAIERVPIFDRRRRQSRDQLGQAEFAHVVGQRAVQLVHDVGHRNLERDPLA